MKYALLSIVLLLLLGCEPDRNFKDFTAEGLKPIYSIDWKDVALEEPRQINQLGKIYYHHGLLLVNELYKGIHVFDNTNPANPIPLSFISIPGNVDVAAKDDILFVDNYSDLLSIRIGNGNSIEIVSRSSNIYPIATKKYPPNHTGYFECVDFNQGIVIGWEKATLTNPKCKS